MRSFNRFLLAGTSHLAILMMGAGGAFAASWEVGVVVDSNNPTYTSSSNVTGPNAANGADGNSSNGGSGTGSVGIQMLDDNTSLSVTGGTVSAGTSGNGGSGGTGSYDGGHGADSAGILINGNNVNVSIGSGATVSGGTAGNGGAAGSTGGSAGGGGAAIGIYVFGSGATITNNGTINAGTGGTNPGTNENNGASGISLGNQETRTSYNTTIINNGTINGGVVYYTTGNTITNNGTINGGVEGNGVSSATITNNGTISNSGANAVSFYSVTEDSTFTNNGTVTGDIQLGVVSGSDHVIYLNKGSTLNGDISAKESGEGSVVIGSSGEGIITLNGDLGELGTYLHAVTIANGATLKLGQDTVMSVGQFHVTGGGTIDLGAYKLSWLHYDQSGDSETNSGTLYFKTTIDTTTGRHGYVVFTKPGGSTETTYLDGGGVSIYPVVVGTVTAGSKYVIIQDTDGRVAQTLPSVVNGSGYSWTVSQVTGSGQTDTDGVSYGSGYTNIIITAANLNAAGSASGTNGAAVKALATYSGDNSELLALSQAVNNLTSNADIKKAGAQLRPETTGNTAQASMGAVTQALSTIEVRADAVRVASSETGTGVSSGETLKGLGVWGQGFGSTASQNERNDVSGYDADTYGLAFGADFKVIDPLRVGLSFAYAQTNVDSTGDRTGSGQDIDSYITSLYGTYSGKGWYVDGALTYGIHKYDAKRYVAISGASAQTLNADYSGQQMGAKAEVGVPLAVGPAVVTPLASLAYNNLKQNSYSESGGSAALEVGSSSTDSIRSGLGAKVAAKVATIGNWDISPNGRAVWYHEFNESSQDQTASYVAGGSSFTTAGTDIATEHFNIGLGLDVASVRNTTVSAKYDVDLADEYVSHSASLQLRTEF